MAILPALCNSFKQEILAMTPHTPTDVYKIALYSASANLSKSTTVYTSEGEVVAPGYTAGGQALSGFNTLLDGDVAILDWSSNPVWPASSIAASGALIYNATRGNKAVAVLAFAGLVTSTNDDFTVTLPTPDNDEAIIRIQ